MTSEKHKSKRQSFLWSVITETLTKQFNHVMNFLRDYLSKRTCTLKTLGQASISNELSQHIDSDFLLNKTCKTMMNTIENDRYLM